MEAQGRRTGRPPIVNRELVRSKYVTFPMSPNEYDALRRAVEATGYSSTSSFIRDAVSSLIGLVDPR